MTMETKFVISNSSLEHLKSSDPYMKALIDYVGNIERFIITDPFTALVNSIIYQQLAYPAATTIWKRFAQLVGEINPKSVIDKSDEALRGCGLSTSKSIYVKEISKAFLFEGFSDINWTELSNEEAIQKLITIKGIGRWTAEMFLMFCLGRENVFSYGDLGLRNGIAKLYKLNNDPTSNEVDIIKKAWAPYETIAAFYLWEITLQKITLMPTIDYSTSQIFSDGHGIGYYHSTIGWLRVDSLHDAITAIEFCDTPDFSVHRTTEVILKLYKELDLYFTGDLKEFNVKINPKGTEFQTAVWNELKKVKYGTLATYGEIAERIGNPKASRAVGMANNRNPIPIIIPCHRIIGANKKLVGYRGGLGIKEILLDIEKEYKDKDID